MIYLYLDVQGGLELNLGETLHPSAFNSVSMVWGVHCLCSKAICSVH